MYNEGAGYVSLIVQIMIEPILKALIKLFALISDIHSTTGISSRGKDIVRLFLAHHLNNEMVIRYMELFDEYVQLYHSDDIDRGSLKARKRTSLTSVRILAICETINEELQQKQKLYVFIQLLDFLFFSAEITENELDFMETVSAAFNIPPAEYGNIREFILGSVDGIQGKNRVMLIDSTGKCEPEGVKHLAVANLKGKISLLYVSGTNTYLLRYTGEEDLFLNGQIIFEGQTYVFDHGSTIRNPVCNTIYFNDVNRVFTEEAFSTKIALDASDISLSFRNSENGLHNIYFHEESGTLVGVLGGSGVGKTTLLNVLSGMAQPDEGEVRINGYDLYSEAGKERLKGVIGFVPQDDLLIEELTVFQNLYYNARMCLDNHSAEELAEAVDTILTDMDLFEIRDLKVGNPLNKVISGGQRKRLNIALELIREPTILFADEPTSGLSSVDSETVMNLLKELTYKGKLVIINIHQPGSDIYKMFDKVIFIDRGGFQIFYGNPTEAVVYFKTMAGFSNANEDQCIACGNINADQMLQIVEARVMNEYGKPTHIRKVSPGEWAEKFAGHIRKIRHNVSKGEMPVPENFFSLPGLLKQSKIFFIRDLLSKLANRQYVLISMLGAPLLAFLLAYFTRYETGGSYHFSENENLPAYLFMCVITSLFLGLIISAEEIAKDRKILRRESFLNLSRFSYLNSKIMIMFMISAIQTISFILIGNSILQIRGMTLSYWIVLFTTSCFANMLGLNISSAFNSVITIYILIPFILIPQLLFSGVMVKFDRLRSSNPASSEFVPLLGDLMAARWSYEALAVEQFKNNRFEKNFFRNDLEINQNDWYSHYLVTALRDDLTECLKFRGNTEYGKRIKGNYHKLNLYIDRLNALAGFGTIEAPWRSSLKNGSLDSSSGVMAGRYLDTLGRHFNSLRIAGMERNDSIIRTIGTKNLMVLRDRYENEKLKEYLMDNMNTSKSIETPDRIIQKYAPVFMRPVARDGRAHFYAPYKMIGELKADTYWFNVTVLWLATILMYIALYYNILERAITYFGSLPVSLRRK